jgi:hypothetical protein
MAWLIISSEPSVAPAEMIMSICALLTSVVIVITSLRMMVPEGGARSIMLLHQLNLCGNIFYSMLSVASAPS